MEIENTTSLLLAFEDKLLGSVFADYLQHMQMKTTQVEGLMNVEVVEHLTQKLYDAIVMGAKENRGEIITAVKEVRDYSPLPIYVLLPTTEKELTVDLYKAGADDVIIHPASPEILACKIEALQRRLALNQEGQTEYKIGEVLFNSERQLLIEGEEIQHLSGRETELLKLLADNQNKVVEKGYILRKIWKADNYFNGRSLSVYVNHLRNLLKNQSKVQIMSIHGRGYKLLVAE